MADNTGIEWTASVDPETGEVIAGATWNPIIAYHEETGKRGWFCVHKSPGCKNCYAEKINIRLGNGLEYIAQNLSKVRFALAPKFDQPMKWKRSRKIFVDSMFDLFLEGIPDELIDTCFAIMSQSPQHTFLVLTKCADRMHAYLSHSDRQDLIDEAGCKLGWCHSNVQGRWPLPNVWLGVSTERQEEANERIPKLLATSAAKRFISYEPALGPLDLANIRLGPTLSLDARCGCT
jgi:protein gp37